MLKRNKVLVAFVLVAALCMSIGFAAVTDTLTVGGTFAFNASDTNTDLVNQFNEKIKFTSAKVGDTVEGAAEETGTATIAGISQDGDNSKDAGDKLTITLSDNKLTSEGDVYYVVATISNENAGKATVAVTQNSEQNDKSDYLDIDITVANNGSLPGKTGENAGTVDVTIKFTLIKAPSESITTSNTFGFTLTATSAD